MVVLSGTTLVSERMYEWMCMYEFPIREFLMSFVEGCKAVVHKGRLNRLLVVRRAFGRIGGKHTHSQI